MDVAAYLDRLGLANGATTPVDVKLLAELVRAHHMTVPFENLDIHDGIQLSVDEAHLEDKLIRRRRGGICYELNASFANLLKALGFQVELVAGQVFRKDGSLGPPFDHMALRVFVAGQSEAFLVDVGFGEGPRAPLPLRIGASVRSPRHLFQLRETSGQLHMESISEDGRHEGYLFDLTPRSVDEFAPGLGYHQRSAASFLTSERFVTRATTDGRVTLHGSVLILTRGSSHERVELPVDPTGKSYQRLLLEHFDIDLSRRP